LRFSRSAADSRSLRADHFEALPGFLVMAGSKHAVRSLATFRHGRHKAGHDDIRAAALAPTPPYGKDRRDFSVSAFPTVAAVAQW
jgi:hypothetical protein